MGLPRLPIAMDGLAHTASSPPAIGQETRAIMKDLRYTDADIDRLLARQVVTAPA